MTAPRLARVRRTHEIVVTAPVARTFPLFTPRGEQDWVPDWEPTFVHPLSGDLERHMVFTTPRHGDAVTVWTVTSLDEPQHEVEYFYVTPGERTCRICVRCADNGDRTTTVRVSYEVTALSEKGNEFAASFTQEYFEEWLGTWEKWIRAYLDAAKKDDAGR